MCCAGLDSKKVEECGCELGHAAGPGERKWASAAFGFPVKARPPGIGIKLDQMQSIWNIPLHSLSSIKSTLLFKTSVLCCFPTSKHQIKTEINLTLQWVLWLPISNYATESSTSLAAAVTAHRDSPVSWHSHTNVSWLVSRSIYCLHQYWVKTKLLAGSWSR